MLNTLGYIHIHIHIHAIPYFLHRSKWRIVRETIAINYVGHIIHNESCGLSSDGDHFIYFYLLM